MEDNKENTKEVVKEVTTDFSVFVKNIEKSLNDALGDIGYVLFLCDKAPGKPQATLISNVGTERKVYEIIKRYNNMYKAEFERNMRRAK